MDDDAKRWRKELRAEKIAAREALSPEERAAATAAIVRSVAGLLEERSPQILGFTWAMQGEVELRPLVETWLAGDPARRAALPVVVGKRPMIFREWTPKSELTTQGFGVTIPADGEELRPDLLLIPLVAFDDACFRLGYGGGFYDRTLAAAEPRLFTIGVGYELGRLPSIDPQPHDVPLDAVVTEAAIRRRALWS